MIERFVKLVESAGGFVHPHLQLLVGDAAEHGQVSLAGVPSDRQSLLVPWELEETPKKPGPWLQFLRGLGYDIESDEFLYHHSFSNQVMPLISAANHSDESPGSLEKGLHGMILHGTTFNYGRYPVG